MTYTDIFYRDLVGKKVGDRTCRNFVIKIPVDFAVNSLLLSIQGYISGGRKNTDKNEDRGNQP